MLHIHVDYSASTTTATSSQENNGIHLEAAWGAAIFKDETELPSLYLGGHLQKLSGERGALQALLTELNRLLPKWHQHSLIYCDDWETVKSINDPQFQFCPRTFHRHHHAHQQANLARFVSTPSWYFGNLHDLQEELARPPDHSRFPSEPLTCQVESVKTANGMGFRKHLTFSYQRDSVQFTLSRKASESEVRHALLAALRELSERTQHLFLLNASVEKRLIRRLRRGHDKCMLRGVVQVPLVTGFPGHLSLWPGMPSLAEVPLIEYDVWEETVNTRPMPGGKERR